METSSTFHDLKQRLSQGSPEVWESWPPTTLSFLSSFRDSSGRSLLFYAPTASAVSFLHHHSCDPRLVDSYGQTALHTAVAADLLPVAQSVHPLPTPASVPLPPTSPHPRRVQSSAEVRPLPSPHTRHRATAPHPQRH